MEAEHTLPLPYQLFDYQTGDAQFTFSLVTLDEKRGSVSGEFEAVYQSGGMDCRFPCDITLETLYPFYIALDNAFDVYTGKDPVVILEGSGATQHRSRITLRFDKKGHTIVNGQLMNRDTGCQSGICFRDVVIDNLYMTELIGSLMKFYDALKDIRGNSNFF